jgi:hypothetical protein
VAVDNKTLDSGAKLVQAWGNLSESAIIAATILGLSIIAAIVIWIIYKFRHNKILTEQKNKRAQGYRITISKLENKVDGLLDKLGIKHSEVKDLVVGVQTTLIELKSEITSLKEQSNANDVENRLVLSTIGDRINNASVILNHILDKTEGTIPIKDSELLIRIYFLRIIYFESEKIIHKALEENGYKSRPDYVADLVRTEVGKMLSSCRGELNDFQLSINPSKFFKLDSGSISERMLLVDMIWDGVESLFTSKADIHQKMEEASLKLTNVLNDYISEIFSRETHTESFVRTKSDFGRSKSQH